MLLKVIICLLLLANIVVLALAYRAMMVDMGNSEGTRTAKYLTIRVAWAPSPLVPLYSG